MSPPPLFSFPSDLRFNLIPYLARLYIQKEKRKRRNIVVLSHFPRPPPNSFHSLLINYFRSSILLNLSPYLPLPSFLPSIVILLLVLSRDFSLSPQRLESRDDLSCIVLFSKPFLPPVPPSPLSLVYPSLSPSLSASDHLLIPIIIIVLVFCSSSSFSSPPPPPPSPPSSSSSRTTNLAPLYSIRTSRNAND